VVENLERQGKLFQKPSLPTNGIYVDVEKDLARHQRYQTVNKLADTT
jgi:hypothetical protein